MTKEDFTFSIGFQGDSAIVDGKTRKQNKNLGVDELAEKGLFRAAFCSALFDDDETSMKSVISIYNEKSGSNLETVDDMKRMLGIYAVPDGIKKTTVIN
ncbi:MAG: hypothetical protein PQJ46_10380 [Spirochaetales bacterium]|nr:hypothetical protein [Spirochaetales bacterium]